MNSDRILEEVDSLLRNIPSLDKIHDEFDWIGRATVVIGAASRARAAEIRPARRRLISDNRFAHSEALNEIVFALKTTRHELRFKSVGPTSSVTKSGDVFEYFDEIRKIIELANSELFFVDPYLDAEFISKFTPHVKPGVSLKFLTSTKDRYLQTLLPAVGAYHVQSSNPVEVKTNKFHDRFIFVDNDSCFQSGASFKDGAKKDPVIITQIIDAFPAVFSTYSDLWVSGNQELKK